MREEIQKYLSTVMQSTAKTLSEKLCMDRLAVSRELNAMVSEGMLERKLEGAGGRHSEYQYWLTRKDAAATPKDAANTKPNSLIEAVVTAANNALPKVENPEVTEAEVSAVEETLDLALQLQTMTRERDDLVRKFLELGDKTTVMSFKKQIAELEDKASVLQLKFDRETVAHHETRADRDNLRAEVDRLRRKFDEMKAHCESLQVQIDQYDERQRFEAYFKRRAEAKGSSDSASLKEKMWESWLERSKVVEVAA